MSLIKVLWVEDGAEAELQNMIGAVNYEGCYDLEIADDASEAEQRIKNSQYDVILIDMRIPPGIKDDYRNIYTQAGSDSFAACMGMHLIIKILKEYKKISPTNVDYERFVKKIGVFTIYTEDELNMMIHSIAKQTTKKSIKAIKDILSKRYSCKSGDSGRDELLNAIKKVKG